MSRDWTPKEAYMVEQARIQQGGGDFWDFLSSVKWTQPGQEPVRLHSDEEVALRQEFPVLGKFLDSFLVLYERLEKYENGIEFLKLQDLELQEYISTGNHNPNSFLARWFEGKLVDNFHYCTQNDALLIECVCEEAMLHTGKQYDVYMEYRLDWYAEHGIDETAIAQFKQEYLDDVQNGRFEGTFHQYEMEFGYRGGVLFYDSFDVFLDKHYGEQCKDVDGLIADAVEVSEKSGCSMARDVVDFEKG